MRTIPRRTALLAPLAAALGLSVTDFPDWQAPQAHATAIAGTGVPLLRAKNVLDSAVNRGILGSGVFNGLRKNVTQTSYQISLTLSVAAAATVPFALVELEWIDSATNIEVATDTFVVPASSSGPAFQVTGSGPVKADTVTCIVTNLDPAQPMTLNYTTYQTSHPFTRDDWHWLNAIDNGAAVPGWTLPTLPQDESVLGVLDAVTIPASGQNTYLFGMSAGLVNFGYEVNTGSASNLSIRIRPKPDSSYSGHNIIYSATQPPANFQVAAPRAPLGVVVANSATTNMVLSLSAIRAD